MNTIYSHRGLTDPDFITKLKNSKFLLEVENNKNLVVGIRDEYINIYHNCDSLAKIEFKRGKIKTSVGGYYVGKKGTQITITLIPGDAATPIADKIADLSTRFLIVLCAIYLEKYLVIITGYASWYLLIPVGLLLLAAWFAIKKGGAKPVLLQLSTKLIVLGLAIALVIPASVKVSSIIEETYSASIQQTIDSATQATEEIEAATGNTGKTGLNIFTSIQQGVTGAVENLEQILNRFMEAIAVMIVTSCVIPVVVLMFFWWLVKMIIGVRIPLPPRIAGYIPEKPVMFADRTE